MKNFKFGTRHKNPHVSIIIVAYNTGQELIDCLQSISRQTIDNFECIVVDNSSEDLNSLSKFNINYLKLDKNYGPSYARNIGAQHARGEILVFLDDDAIAKDNLIEVITQTFTDKSIVAVRGKVVPKTKKNIYNNLARHYDLGEKKIDFILTPECNCAVRQSDFIKIGGFDPKLYGHEGVDLSYKLAKYGRQLYIPNAIAYHDFGDNLRHYLRKQYRHGYNKKLFLQNYPKLVAYSDQFKFPKKVYNSIDLNVFLSMKLLIIRTLSFGVYLSGIVIYRVKVDVFKRKFNKHLLGK